MSNYFTDNPCLEQVLQHPVLKQIAHLKEGRFEEASRYDFAPRDLDEAIRDYREIMLQTGAVCGEVIAPHAREVDLQGPRLEKGRVIYAEGTQENHRSMVQAGLYGMTLERRFGGLNLPTTLFVMATELVARADSSFTCLWALQNCAETIAAFGSEEQKERYLPRITAGATCSMDLTEPDAGSDLQSAMLSATWSEEHGTWLLNGVKRFITNGDADLKLVLARTESGTTDARGLSLFVVDREQGGVTVRRLEKKLGIKGSATCELVFENAPAELIGTRRMGLIRYVMSLMNAARLGIGAQSVGIAEAALREAECYAAQRLQFGKPIARMAAVSELLATMRTKIDAARALLYETARQVDLSQCYGLKLRADGLEDEERQALKTAQRLADMYTPLLKLMAGEECNRIAYDALQVFGGSGYMQDFAIERLYRDARVVTIYEGTSQMQVVAAMKYVVDGSLVAQLKQLAEQCATKTAYESERAQLLALTERFDKLVAFAANEGETCTEYHARRLVECGAMTLMGYLLLLDAEDERSVRSMKHYVTMATACVAAHEATIHGLSVEMIETLRHAEEGLFAPSPTA